MKQVHFIGRGITRIHSVSLKKKPKQNQTCEQNRECVTDVQHIHTEEGRGILCQCSASSWQSTRRQWSPGPFCKGHRQQAQYFGTLWVPLKNLKIWVPEILKTWLEVAVHNSLKVCPDFFSFSCVFQNSTEVWLHFCISAWICMIRSSVPEVVNEAAFNHSWRRFWPLCECSLKKKKGKPNIQIKEIIKYTVLLVRTYDNARLLLTNPAEIR